MERIKTIATRDLTKSVQTGGCGECHPPDAKNGYVTENQKHREFR